MQKIIIPMILVCTSEMFKREIYISHGGLTENVPFTNHKNRYFIVQMVAYTIVNVNSEQGQSVI